MNNNDLGNLAPKGKQKEQEAPQQEKDPTEEFDSTRKTRRGILDDVGRLIDKAKGQSKINRKDLIKTLTGLQQYCVYSEHTLTALMYDFFRVIKAVGQGEVNNFSVRATIEAIVTALADKELLTEDDIRKAYEEKVAPKTLPKDTPPEVVAELKTEDLAEQEVTQLESSEA